MELEQEFNSFLDSNNSQFKKDIGNSTMLILKSPYNKKIDILYGCFVRSDYLNDFKNSLSYYGIYDKENKKVYNPNYNLKYTIYHYSENDIRLINSDMLYDEISNLVNEKIGEHILDEPDMFDYKNIDIGPVYESDVYEDFMNGKTSSNLEDKIILYKAHDSNDILEYLTYKDEFIDEKARSFIVDNVETILKNLKYCDEKRKVLKQIEDDKNYIYHKQRDILNSIKDKDYKTVNITINKDGIEQTFKYETKYIQYSREHLYSFHIVKCDDRKLFEENYGSSADIEYGDITKITYGKNVIYEDSNFKSNDLEDDNVYTK